jgi:thiol-disulfide isomerase/thioredoxin
MRKFFAAMLCCAALLMAQAPRRAPGFCLIDSHGQWHDLADYRGKPVIVEFMQTNCPHCAAFVPVLEKARQKYGDRIAILAIALPPDNPNTMMEYVSGHNIAYPVLFDQGQVAASYVRTPRLGFPTIYLVDPEGMIYANFTYGPMTRDIFEGNGLTNELDRLMASASKKR